MENIVTLLLDLLSTTITLEEVDVSIQLQIPLLIPIAMGISALAAGGSAIAGGIKNRQNQQILGDLSKENEQRYLQEYYRGALDNDASKAYLKRLTTEMDKHNKALENSVVASGATHENALAQKQANNEVMSDAIAGLVEREDARKRDTENRYLTLKNQLAQGQMSQNAAVANNWANLGQGISSAAGSLASAYLMDGKVINSSIPANPYSGNPYWNNKLNNLIQ